MITEDAILNFIGNWFQCFPVYPSLNLSSGSGSVSVSGSGSGFRIPDSGFSIRPPPCATLLQHECSGNTHFVSNCININYRRVVHAPRTWRTELTVIVTALFTNMRILKFKSQLTIVFFAAVNHLNGPLREQNFSLTGSKGHGL